MLRKTIAIVLVCASTLACATPKVVQVDALKAPELTDEALLDAAIVVFATGVTAGEEPPERVNPQIRTAEANYFPYLLRTTLEETRQWGAVRVVPASSPGSELTVEGEILESNGMVLRLRIEAHDATGRKWLDKNYETGLDEAAYHVAETKGEDPYQPLFNLIANDLVMARERLAPREIARIRDVAQMRFAAALSPDPFADYLEQGRGGAWQLTRLPAHDDPTLQRVLQIRDRDAMFLEALNAHYTYFAQEMDKRGYRDLREAAMVEERAYRDVKRKANLRKISGIALVLAGAAAAVAGGNDVSAILGTATAAAGVEVARGGFQMSGEAQIHREAIEELTASFDSEVTPVVLEMQGDTVRLTGTATAQYEEWRRLLASLYRAETDLQVEGLPVVEVPVETPDEQPAISE